jgi:hypothetical protein
MGGRNWTKEETDFLKENYGKMPTGEIAEHLGRSKSSVTTKACRLNAVPNLCLHWRPEEIAVLREVSGSMPWKDVAARVGRSVRAVRDQARKLGLPSNVRVWTPLQDALIYEMSERIDQKDAAQILGVTYHALRYRVRELGISWGAGQTTRKEVQERLGISHETMRRYTAELGIVRRKRKVKRRYQIRGMKFRVKGAYLAGLTPDEVIAISNMVLEKGTARTSSAQVRETIAWAMSLKHIEEGADAVA